MTGKTKISMRAQSNGMNGRNQPLRLGISSCLLGQEVRYDGGHKRDRFLTDTLGNYVTWVPVCPEVEIGLGTPRPTIRLEETSDGVRLVMPSTGDDLTVTMRDYSIDRVQRLEKHGLAGYVLKKDSPSCGMERVKIRDQNDVPARTGVGIYAAELMRLAPDLPIEEEGRLNDPRLRENFITRIFSYQRWLDLVDAGPTRRALMEYHAAHKYVLMSRNQAGMRRLGKLLGEAPKGGSTHRLAEEYRAGMTAVMRRVPTRKGHTNVLRHMAGYVSDGLDSADRAELTESIDHYHAGLLPLIVPVTLLRHWVRKFEVETLQNQVYLWPHPHEMMLLNHV
ncbi:MAG: DUF523 and DUF1722 domain-containing protein [Gemmatimonadota bacterium]|jgi:uncharacterized protein YbgA (DUF1722 family)/uncharacterized protein YbbK (DUF523 family)